MQTASRTSAMDSAHNAGSITGRRANYAAVAATTPITAPTQTPSGSALAVFALEQKTLIHIIAQVLALIETIVKHRCTRRTMNNNLPEGLFLSWGTEGVRICDAQDVTWVDFATGGLGDPPDWRANIIRNACRALNVREAVSDDGDVVEIDFFIDNILQ